MAVDRDDRDEREARLDALLEEVRTKTESNATVIRNAGKTIAQAKARLADSRMAVVKQRAAPNK